MINEFLLFSDIKKICGNLSNLRIIFLCCLCVLAAAKLAKAKTGLCGPAAA